MPINSMEVPCYQASPTEAKIWGIRSRNIWRTCSSHSEFKGMPCKVSFTMRIRFCDTAFLQGCRWQMLVVTKENISRASFLWSGIGPWFTLLWWIARACSVRAVATLTMEVSCPKSILLCMLNLLTVLVSNAWDPVRSNLKKGDCISVGIDEVLGGPLRAL